MPWCPVCKNEYKEGYTHCNDCNVDLVPTLDDMPKPVMFGEKEEMEDMKELLSKKGIKDTLVVYDEKDKVHELCVKPEFAEEATQILKSYFEAEMQNEAAQAYSAEELLDEEGNLTEEAMAAAIAMEESRRPRQAYADKKDKAEDYKSSAYTLFLVGGIGLLLIILHAVGVIPFALSGTNKYMMYLVMGALFVIFIISGIMALRSAKKFEVMDVEEKDLMKEIEAFLETITIEALDRDFNWDSDATVEMKYFNRMARLKSILEMKFPDAAQDMLDKMADDYYDAKFGNE